MVPEELQAMLRHDEAHWWYRGRRRVLAALLDALDLPAEAAILDVGCGSGRTLMDLRRRGRACGADISPVAVRAAVERGLHVVRARAEELPYPDGRFDLVTCLDVLEHTADDERTLRELHRVTRPGGHVVLTVPAHQALWSQHDVVNRHFRRYSRRALRDAALRAGFQVRRETAFNAAILVPAAAVRLWRRRHPGSGGRSDLERTPVALDAVLEWPNAVEAGVIRRGGRVPAGLSLAIVLRAPVLVTGRGPISKPRPLTSPAAA